MKKLKTRVGIAKGKSKFKYALPPISRMEGRLGLYYRFIWRILLGADIYRRNK